MSVEMNTAHSFVTARELFPASLSLYPAAVALPGVSAAPSGDMGWVGGVLGAAKKNLSPIPGTIVENGRIILDINGNGKYDAGIDGVLHEAGATTAGFRRALRTLVGENPLVLDPNTDGKVTAEELAEMEFGAWIDKNKDGKVQANELFQLNNLPDAPLKDDILPDGHRSVRADLVYDEKTKKFVISKKPLSPADAKRVAALDRDVYDLHKAMEGWGTDEAAISRILANRSNAEIKYIKARYQERYGISLEAHIRDENSSWYLSGLLDLLHADRDESGKVDVRQCRKDATDLWQALNKFNTDEATLIRVLCNRSAQQIQEIKRQYQEMYRESLRGKVVRETGGDFEGLMLALLH